jgi:glycine cleavage system H protein
MEAIQKFKKNVYFTNEHEWIDFQGAVAYIGVCSFKLTGIRSIESLTLQEPGNPYKKGDLIATIKYKEYSIPVCMPVDGKLLQINEKLLNGKEDILLTEAEDIGWIGLIVPSQPDERNGLLLPKDYPFVSK